MTYVIVRCERCGEATGSVPDNIYKGPADGRAGMCVRCVFDMALREAVDGETAAIVKAVMITAGIHITLDPESGQPPRI
ncbi:MAG: hypothetical protein JOY78_20335 [Pseudonocardia sp.]|nr:hypothetical protein [Pseudonocardia sp.]